MFNLNLFIIAVSLCSASPVETAAPAPEIHADRPWYFPRISSAILEAAISNRASSVPEAEASSVASRIIAAGMAPPQVTALLGSASSILLADGTDVPPATLLHFVDAASTAYQQVRASQGFDSYLKYISANAKDFDLQGMASGTRGTEDQRNMAAMLQQRLAKLEQTADGKNAVDTARQLMKEIAKDAGVTLPNFPNKVVVDN